MHSRVRTLLALDLLGSLVLPRSLGQHNTEKKEFREHLAQELEREVGTLLSKKASLANRSAPDFKTETEEWFRHWDEVRDYTFMHPTANWVRHTRPTKQSSDNAARATILWLSWDRSNQAVARSAQNANKSGTPCLDNNI